MTHVDSLPDWAVPPPPEAIRAVIDCAEYAAQQDEARACAVISDSRVDRRWLAIAAVQFLGSLLRQCITDADTLRAEILRVAQQTGATDYTTDAALEAVALAQALQRGDLGTVAEICRASVVSAFDHAHCAAAIAGQTIAACGGDTGVAFAAMRRAHGLAG